MYCSADANELSGMYLGDGSRGKATPCAVPVVEEGRNRDWASPRMYALLESWSGTPCEKDWPLSDVGMSGKKLDSISINRRFMSCSSRPALSE